ncbi:hypothetical protein PMIN03_003289 [Paraphaeosphaeria minitans]
MPSLTLILITLAIPTLILGTGLPNPSGNISTGLGGDAAIVNNNPAGAKYTATFPGAGANISGTVTAASNANGTGVLFSKAFLYLQDHRSLITSTSYRSPSVVLVLPKIYRLTWTPIDAASSPTLRCVIQPSLRHAKSATGRASMETSPVFRSLQVTWTCTRLPYRESGRSSGTGALLYIGQMVRALHVPIGSAAR